MIGWMPYGVNPTLAVGPTIRLISILIYCVQHWPVIEPTLAQRLVFVLEWLHRPIPQPQTHEAFGPSYNNVVNKLTDVNTSSKTYWKFIKLVYGCKQHSPIPDFEHFGNTISDSSEKATLCNNYFVEQCQTVSDADNSFPDFIFMTESRLSNLSINSSDVLKILKGLNTCKAAGHDNINISI